MIVYSNSGDVVLEFNPILRFNILLNKMGLEWIYDKIGNTKYRNEITTKIHTKFSISKSGNYYMFKKRYIDSNMNEEICVSYAQEISKDYKLVNKNIQINI